MLRSFVDEYKSDSKLVVDTEVILEIVDRVQKTPKPNLPQIFVQLGPIIEVVLRRVIALHTANCTLYSAHCTRWTMRTGRVVARPGSQ